MTTINISTAQQVGQFAFFNDGSTDLAVGAVPYIFDVDGDGVDEMIFAGLESQPNTPETFSNISIYMYGWVDGVLQDITDKWLPGDLNDVEAVGSIAFGDFDGDGDLDAYLSANTDMDYSVNSYQLTNEGNVFSKKAISNNAWEHDVFTADINNDGYDDVLLGNYDLHGDVLYLGGANGLKTIPLDINFTPFALGASGVTVADYYGDGTQTAIYTDAGYGTDSTRLIRFKITDDGVSYASNVVLPSPLLATEEYKNRFDVTGSHTIRSAPMDFNNDGLMDVLIFARADQDDNGSWPNVSTIQFLENKGGGIFEDVTDARLVNYDHATASVYNPVIRDYNNDGLLDIFAGDADYDDNIDSFRIIFQQDDGTFVDSPEVRHVLNNQMDGGASAALARGPDGTYVYVWSDQQYGQVETLIFAAKTDIVIAAVTSEPENEVIYLTNLNDLAYSSQNNDYINAGLGIDTIIYPGERDVYSILISSDTTTITDNIASESIDTLIAFERIQFAGINVALDVDGNGGQAYRIYKAAFDRVPDLGGLGFWINALDNGASLTSMASGFTNSVEFESLYGSNNTNKEFVNLMYNNVLDRDADEGGYNFWLEHMDSGTLSREQLLIDFSESTENQLNVIGLISNGIEYTEWIG